MKADVWAATQPGGLDELDAAGAAGGAGLSLVGAKVMMVDDEPLMTDLIQTYLDDAGYGRFVSTNNPLQAMALLRREQPGVLLLDLMMPQMSGFELLEAIRADRALRYLPVIVLTASTGAEAKLRALQLGATDFLAKPVDESELVLRVRNTLAFRQYHDQMINFDAATRLPKEEPFDRGLATMLSRRDLVGGRVALFSVQVPECRQLRDTIDQAAADGLAKVLARRLARFAGNLQGDPLLATPVEQAPRVGRLGVDQFGLLLEGLGGVDTIELLARRLLAVLSEPVPFGVHEVIVSPWLGIALSPGDGDSAEALRKSAALAAAHARAAGAAQFVFASHELNARTYERFQLGAQLRGAVQRGELRLHYQPKLDLGSQRIVGAEALVRWEHPTRGLLPPGLFIQLAEEIGLIREIGNWVIERACRDMAAWAAAGHTGLKVAVNVAKPQFVAGDLCDVLRRAMFDSGLPASQLVVELTESMLMDDVATAIGLMTEMKALGVTLSIDDFGTGYSSLAYLKQFPLDELKIDRSFVMDLPGRHADVAIVRAVVELGHSLGMTVTAEGVETEAQRQCLADMGCDTWQGFHFSRPVPPEALLQLLASSSQRG